MARVLVIADLHFGERGDSKTFNEHILEFIEWAIKTAKEHNVDKIVQLGDWFHHRNKIQVQTLTYAIEGARMLSNAFGKENVFVLAGNHDLYYLDRLDVSSVSALRPYVTIVDKPQTILPGCFATPWVASDDVWGQVIEASATHKYLFSHLELNGFMVNDKYAMEHGRSHRELKDYECVISGHYHSLQTEDNVLYVGTPYPITMNEANEEHGVVILDTDTDEISFIEYTGIRVVSIPFDEIEKILDYDPTKTSIRIEFPDTLEDESIIEETKQLLMEKNFDEVKIKYRGEKAKRLIEADIESVEEVDNIDAAVLSCIEKSVEIESIDKELLKSLYTQAASMEA